MAKDLQYINVIDVEATCWEGDPPPGQTNEIIEIGISVVALFGAAGGKEIVETQSIVVLPTTSQISEFCTRLTTLTPEFVRANGIPFREAAAALRKKFSAQQRVFATWGDYDRKQFQRQCEAERVPYPFGPTHLNVKNLFSLRKGLHREPGVGDALSLLQWEFEGTPHRGVDDSRNIARLLIEIL